MILKYPLIINFTFMNENLINNINDLNHAQKEATFHKDGPLIIIAGAGSGKTRVLTYRIAYLMTQGIDAFSILALTFTNKAAREMKHRISSLVGDDEAKNLWMGTFHSVFAKILRIEAEKLGFPKNFTIYDTQDSERLIKSIIKEMNLNKDLYKSKQIRNRISSLKNNLITVNSYFNNSDLIESDHIAHRPRMGDLYKNYVERCFKSSAMDFDDLLLKTNELLNKFPSVLAKYQNIFKYILVDEYQDTNHSQYLIVKMLSDKFHNICVVGDDSQSIYSFRGANINNILNFKKDYPEVVTYKLEQNYRSTKNIVNAANSIIKYNKSRLEKNLWTSNSDGEKINVRKLNTDSDEGRFISDSIINMKMENQYMNTDFAILYRTNAQSRAIEDALRNNGISYKVYGGLSFYQRKEIKDVLAYLRLIINKNDEESFKRILNYPSRGIGQTTLNKLIVAANYNNISIFEAANNISKLEIPITNKTIIKIRDFITLIKSLSIYNNSSNAYETAKETLIRTKIINDLKNDGTPEGISKIENVEELINGIRDFTESQIDLVKKDTSLTNYLEDIALATDFDNKNIDSNSVSLMTIHLSKGLEFPIVFLAGMEEDLFPSPLNLDTRSGLEEERRLFYVGLTRAMKKAILTFSCFRYRWGNLNSCEPSRFISEIDDEFVNKKYNIDNSINKPIKKIGIIENSINNPSISKLSKLRSIQRKSNSLSLNKISLKEGYKVKHHKFGVGEVIKIEGNKNDQRATIKFNQKGIKKLLLNFAKLSIIKKTL
ncbi:MAG: 3'-5' exonuclease [Flavobacteriaceae bacterium]|nr:3'-5' exonuclease [Flavobacteriaceae bacterium]